MARLFEFQAESLPSWWDGNYQTPLADTNLDLMKDDGAAQVVIAPTVFMDTLTSSTVYRDNSDPGAINVDGRPRTESDASIQHIIADIKARGMDVIFKPHLDTQRIEWRALMAPSDMDAWFASYKDAMVHYAKIAQACGAKAFSIGCELESLSHLHRDKWVDLIQAVREVYSGPLTYSATWSEAFDVCFWDQLDYIGANPYISFTNLTNPTLQQLIDGWTKPSTVTHVRETVGDKPVMDALRDLALANGKPLIFTETGFRSLDGNNRTPWATGTSGVIDEAEQANMFEAFFKIINAYKGDWLAGYWLWNYDAGADAANPAPDNGYYTHGKLADAVIEHYMKLGTPQEPGKYATEGDDYLIGTILANVIDGLGGNDVIKGYDGNDGLIGGAGNDSLYGAHGADILNGGTEADLMDGGAGNDTYYVDNVGDKVVDFATGGIDKVIAAIDYTLAANVENLAASSGSASIKLTGNGLANMISGNAGANIINGGAGADRMEGGAGNDTYSIDNVGDQIVEVASGGIDTILTAALNHTLAANVENLTATGAAALSLTGNALNNTITGNTGANRLSGGDGNDMLNGGAGADMMEGGAGNDTYQIENINDQVIEIAASGVDTILSYISLALVDNVEHLTASGGNSISLTGNSLDNTITGNTGANTISGGNGNDNLSGGAGGDLLDGGSGNDRIDGGLGQDNLTGGADQDSFIFKDALNFQVDQITDFSVIDDRLCLDNAIFTKLGTLGTEAAPVMVNGDFFIIGENARDANDHLIYNQLNGYLYYDADGSGAGQKVVFAQLSAGLGLTHDKFFVI